METITILSPNCVKFVPITTGHSAFGNRIHTRILGNTIEVYAQTVLTSSVAGGAKIAHLPEVKDFGVQLPSYGEILRYTSEADQTPDIRKIKLATDGYLYNANSFTLSAGQLVTVRLTLIGR